MENADNSQSKQFYLSERFETDILSSDEKKIAFNFSHTTIMNNQIYCEKKIHFSHIKKHRHNIFYK